MITQHGVDTGGIVGVPVTLSPPVPAARHDDRAVADLEQSTAAGGASQSGVGGLAAARVLADRVTQLVRSVVVRRHSRAHSREAVDVGTAGQQLV